MNLEHFGIQGLSVIKFKFSDSKGLFGRKIYGDFRSRNSTEVFIINPEALHVLFWLRFGSRQGKVKNGVKLTYKPIKMTKSKRHRMLILDNWPYFDEY